MKKHVKILSPCGILGYGFPEESFVSGMNDNPDAIVVDAGSTDAGPHKLGAGTSIVSRTACKKDLTYMLLAGHEKDIPVIIGSAGGSGAEIHVNWTLEIINEIIEENNLHGKKMAVIWADIPYEIIKRQLIEEKIIPLGSSVPPLELDVLEETNGVVAQMGAEPIIEALSQGAKIIVCGRAYDPAPFAAVGIYNGFDPAYAYHLGKVLECGALSSEPGTTKDCMMGVLYEDGFEVYPTNPERKCTPVSVAAHTFYEKDHPFLLKGPGIILDLEACDFIQVSEGRVKVTGSKLSVTPQYQIKLEGARCVAYRTFVIAGIRDPLLIEQIKTVEEEVSNSVKKQFKEVATDDYEINFYNYGIDGVMGELEPVKTYGHEVGVLFEVVAKTQELATVLCSSVRSTFMHYGYKGRKSTAGNLAFPFAPSDVNFGAVYAFSVYHLMETEDGIQLFPIEYREV
ncbi:acyclic terpene utilization AtuA family protein [Fusibacter bizertensis]